MAHGKPQHEKKGNKNVPTRKKRKKVFPGDGREKEHKQTMSWTHTNNKVRKTNSKVNELS